jgi:hypothetical protein
VEVLEGLEPLAEHIHRDRHERTGEEAVKQTVVHTAGTEHALGAECALHNELVQSGAAELKQHKLIPKEHWREYETMDSVTQKRGLT